MYVGIRARIVCGPRWGWYPDSKDRSRSESGPFHYSKIKKPPRLLTQRLEKDYWDVNERTRVEEEWRVCSVVQHAVPEFPVQP